MRSFIFSLFCCLASFVCAGEFRSEKIASDGERVYVISSFEELDYFTTISHEGAILWEVPFAAQILSWKVEEKEMFIFSRARDGMAFFLACLDLDTGMVKWGNRILSPQQETEVSREISD